MTRKHLGDTFDIHTGGKDLVFPHHTNEIAQSVAATSDALRADDFARYWLHNGFVEIDDEKMSKSLGNFFTVRDVLARYDGEGLRFFLLGTHYRNDFNFSDAILDEAERRLGYLYETLVKAEKTAGDAAPGAASAFVEPCRAALDDDFNTPQVLGLLAEAFTAANVLADKKGKKAPPEKAELRGLRARRTGGLRHARRPAAPAGRGAPRAAGQGGEASRDRREARGGADRSARRGPQGEGLRPLRRPAGRAARDRRRHHGRARGDDVEGAVGDRPGGGSP